ncbi:hypothetical protein [Burkholderia sp. Bp8998]|uniref:hypothetical protein n=1 Tax=Burkholderia sp. Bp8998 TaxID=2184557 RepID=UPI000F595339|nr:hypothetical protein [Burkholderia sp. Bp8998]
MLNAPGIERPFHDSARLGRRMQSKGMRKLVAIFRLEDYEQLNINQPIPFRIDGVNAGNPHAMADRRSPRPIVSRHRVFGPDARQSVSGLMHVNPSTCANRGQARAQGPSALDRRVMRTTLDQVRPACANAVSRIRFATGRCPECAVTLPYVRTLIE